MMRCAGLICHSDTGNLYFCAVGGYSANLGKATLEPIFRG